ncbi:MAG: AbrB/MazE/SpoVT family DNA-binding domain-containing protein [Opitutaceae bacterium]|jgi:AbrB family looped-hinge helix DNA binding protein|nr:AbrB/MazE/SpoVT family DNA-binding domain-containing protein [Opitutaceae bacterium]
MTVTLSTKYQIVLPEELRRAHDFKPGMKFAFIEDGESIRLVPVRGMKSLRGFLKGRLKDSDVGREEKDRPL